MSDLALSSSTSGFGLDPEFAATLALVLADCRAAGYEFRVSQGLRTPQTQADYYCRWEKRSPEDIDAKATELESKGAPWIAGLLRARRKIKRQKAWLTNAMPGAGWHQWGLAADCYCYRNGKMVESGDDPCYAFYANAATKRGLRAGLYFSSPDAGHVQGPQDSGASNVYTWSKIDAVMRERFGEKPAILEPTTPKTFANGAAHDEVTFEVVVEAAAAKATYSFFKNDPSLQSAPLVPSKLRKAPGNDPTLKAMAQVYNATGGLIEALAAQLQIDPVAMLSVWLVESSGTAFTPGKPIIRFEVHKFWKYWGQKNPALFDRHFRFGGHAGVGGKSHENHQFRPSPTATWAKFHGNQDKEYAVLRFAEQLGGREAACLSASWGGPQVMGFNYGTLGYPSATAMADAFTASERWHVLGFADFCNANNLLDEIRDKQWTAFGTVYNGSAQYGGRIDQNYTRRTQFLALPLG